MALAFVSSKDVVFYYDKLVSIFNKDFATEIVEIFCNYMEYTWVGVATRGKRRNLLYSIKLKNY